MPIYILVYFIQLPSLTCSLLIDYTLNILSIMNLNILTDPVIVSFYLLPIIPDVLATWSSKYLDRRITELKHETIRQQYTNYMCDRYINNKIMQRDNKHRDI